MIVPDILEQIVTARRERIARSGPAQGIDLPAEREVPVVPFPGPVICEIKRRSPSRGALATGIDPVERASQYRDAGAMSVSVLTEEDHFSGALADLIAVKRAYPDLGVLRKDFLLSTEDVVVSYRAGADAILLIAAILPPETLGEMLSAARELGIAALVEVHDVAEVDAVRPYHPELIGINSRDLRTFRVDLLGPLEVANAIDWRCRTVFESGIFHREDVAVARDGGFGTVLVGESVVKDPARVAMLVSAMEEDRTVASTGRSVSLDSPRDTVSFWPSIARQRSREPYRPLIKICGITNLSDARIALRYGADCLGLIYAESPRTAPEGLAVELRNAGIDIPLVGVVVEGVARHERLLQRAQSDLAEGVLSALQLHGSSPPDESMVYGWPVYKAMKFESKEAVRSELPLVRTPRVLVDAYHPAIPGGTGTSVEGGVLDEVVAVLSEQPHGELWLAGGLNPDTVYQAIIDRRPELIDASSGLEAEPGRKSETALRRYAEAIDEAAAKLQSRTTGGGE